MMIPTEGQVKKSTEGIALIKQTMIVYLAMEERTGKTLTAILICEALNVNDVLVVTKKKALPGWKTTLDVFPHKKNYDVVNYHQLAKMQPGFHDLVIFDEAHNYLSAFPKPSAMWKTAKLFTGDLPIIYMSATPYAQGVQLLYHQFALSSWSPFEKWTSGYNWFRAFGIPDITYLHGRHFESYKKFQTEEVLAYCKRLFVTATRKEMGFTHEPKDELHYFELSDNVKDVYNLLMKHKIIELNGHTLTCDTPMKLRTTLHMLEGGVAKVGTKEKPIYLVLGADDKIAFIKDTWGDTENMVIMYQYIAEGIKLREAFKFAEVLQATSYAEGVDLSHKQHLLIYSQDFSTARHSQRRARQANMNREAPILVHFLLVKKAISDQVYQTVSVNKTNFVDSVFTREAL